MSDGSAATAPALAVAKPMLAPSFGARASRVGPDGPFLSDELSRSALPRGALALQEGDLIADDDVPTAHHGAIERDAAIELGHNAL